MFLCGKRVWIAISAWEKSYFRLKRKVLRESADIKSGYFPPEHFVCTKSASYLKKIFFRPLSSCERLSGVKSFCLRRIKLLECRKIKEVSVEIKYKLKPAKWNSFKSLILPLTVKGLQIFLDTSNKINVQRTAEKFQIIVFWQA